MVSTESHEATLLKLGPDLSSWRGSRELSNTSGLHTSDPNSILPITPRPGCDNENYLQTLSDVPQAEGEGTITPVKKRLIDTAKIQGIKPSDSFRLLT